jgi:hypothetical protein
MPPRFTTKAGDREGLLARMLEHDVDVVALAGDVPDRLAELARFLCPGVVFGRADLGHLAPAVEVLAVDDALGAERHDEVALGIVGDDADGVGAGHRAELHAEQPRPPGAPQTSTLWPGAGCAARWPNSMR